MSLGEPARSPVQEQLAHRRIIESLLAQATDDHGRTTIFWTCRIPRSVAAAIVAVLYPLWWAVRIAMSRRVRAIRKATSARASLRLSCSTLVIVP